MDETRFHNTPESDDLWYSLINGMMLINTEKFFQAVYDAIQKHPTYVILSDFDSDRKLYILEQMLKHYENKEDFEKCKVIFEVKKQVESEC
jgi:hypothetical protein